MALWTLLLVLSIVPVSLAGETLAEVAILSIRHIEDECGARGLKPWNAVEERFAEGGFVAHVDNRGQAFVARVCLFDAWGEKRLDETIALAQGERRDVVLAAPPGVYMVRIEAQEGRVTYEHRSWINTRWCISQTHEVSIWIDLAGGGGIEGGGCTEDTLAMGAVGLLGATAAILLSKFPHLGAFLLYSRLAKPRVLDHAMRERLVELVSREPGIHTSEVVRALGAADGQIAYHLGVLSREGVVVSLGAPGFRHWFVAGRCSPPEMRALAALRDPTRRALRDVVTAEPGITLTAAADAVGISKPAASRASRVLERAGVLERANDGRALVLRPARA